mgnify:CR=1 FL=1
MERTKKQAPHGVRSLLRFLCIMRRVLCAEAFSVVLVYSAECRPNVLRLGIANDVVNRIKDITSALGQNIQTLDNLCCNLFRIAARERRLRVNAAAPEYQLIAVFTA